jgi:hypothetical protein
MKKLKFPALKNRRLARTTAIPATAEAPAADTPATDVPETTPDTTYEPRHPARKKPRVTTPKPLAARKLAMKAYREWRADWKPYTKIVAVVVVPGILMSAFPSLAVYSSGGLNLPLAVSFMTLALIWAIIQRRQTGQVPNVPQAYYTGTAAILRYALVGLILTLYAIPAAIGLALYALGLLAAEYSGTFGIEQVLVGLLAILLIAPTFYLLIRYNLAFIPTVEDGLRPVAALRRTRLVTLGRFWPLAARLVMLFIFVVIVSVPFALLSLGVSLIHLPMVFTALVQAVFLLILLPLLYLYIYNLYRDLADTAPGAQPVPENMV